MKVFFAKASLSAQPPTGWLRSGTRTASDQMRMKITIEIKMIIIREILMIIVMETNFSDIFLFTSSPSSEALSSHLTSTLSLAMWHGLPTQGWLFPILSQIKIVLFRGHQCINAILTIFCNSLQWTPSKAPSLLLSRSTARFTSSTSTMTNTSHYVCRCLLLSSSSPNILILIIIFSNMLTIAIVHKAVVSKSQARLTHISFNLAHPVIITGDNKGQVVIWWLWGVSWKLL